MTNHTHQPSPEYVPSKSNKKVWIIVGSLVGGLVIIMGGCVACVALIGLSRLSDDDLGTASDSRSIGKDEVRGLAATSWSGTLNCEDGDNLSVIFKFAETGNPLYDYQTSSGLREVELTSPGQTIRFVPSGGGVTNIVLDTISVAPTRMNHTMSVSRESSGGGTLIQSRSTITTEAALSGTRLEVQTRIRSSSAASQPGYLIPDESDTICRGNLAKQ